MIIVAEIGTSHNGNLEKAFKMIDEAKEAGADIVKFQWVYAEEILHPDTGFVKLPTGNIRLFDRFRELEVGRDFYASCSDYAHKKGLLFACSPFGLKSLEELLEIGCDAVKIASPEVNHLPMLEKISDCYGKIPIILSSGVSHLGDLEKAISILTKKNPDFSPYTKVNGNLSALTLLHCITFYPAPEEEYNVRCVKTLGDVLGVPCGISDHSLDPVLVPVLSALMGGTMIEKHITLSRKTDGLDDPVALEGEQFALMSHCVHQTQAVINRFRKEEDALNNLEDKAGYREQIPDKAVEYGIKQLSQEYDVERIYRVLGNGVKKLAASESANYGRTNRSLHYMRAMKKGETVRKEDIAVLRTEKVLTPGIAPEYQELVTGLILKTDVTNGQGVKLTDFTERDPKYI